jgi:hypothetical protein
MTINNHSFKLKYPQRSFNDVFADMKSLLERLAPEECPEHLVPEYYDSPSLGCKYCDCTTTTKGEWDHTHDCLWVEARKLLEELK